MVRTCTLTYVTCRSTSSRAKSIGWVLVLQKLLQLHEQQWGLALLLLLLVVVVVLHNLGVVLEMVEWAVVLRWWVVLGLVEYAVVLRVGATAEGVSLRGKPLPPLRFRWEKNYAGSKTLPASIKVRKEKKRKEIRRQQNTPASIKVRY